MINHKQEREKKKYKLFSYFCDGRTFKVYDVERSTFAPALVWVWFSLFFLNLANSLILQGQFC